MEPLNLKENVRPGEAFENFPESDSLISISGVTEGRSSITNKYTQKSDIDRLINLTTDLSMQEAEQSPSSEEVSQKLLSDAKQLYRDGKKHESLKKAREAHKIYPCHETTLMVSRLEAICASELEKETSSPEFASRSSGTSQPSTQRNSTATVTSRTSKSSIEESLTSAQSCSAGIPTEEESSPKVEAISEAASSVLRELYQHSRELSQAGKLAEAVEVLEQAQAMLPSPRVERRIARMREALAGDPSRAAEAARLESKARACYHQGDYHGALKFLTRAYEALPSDKLQRRIQRMRQAIAEMEEEEEEEEEEDDEVSALAHSAANLSLVETKADMVELAEGFYLPRRLHEQLFPYQRDGVAWLWNLHNTAPGGILADDMGLGKTFQTIAFLTGLFLAERRCTVLILAPVAMLQTWKREFARWSPSLRVHLYFELTRNARQRTLVAWQSHGGVLLTSYEMLVAGIEDIAADQRPTSSSRWLSSKAAPSSDFELFPYDYLILDEAHRIKNPSTKVAKSVRFLDSKHRLLLTGTAVQNNLRELWALLDFTHNGTLLGTQKTFLTEFEKPITRSRERDANAAERELGSELAQWLNARIQPFVLRRTKANTLTKGSLPQKNEIVVWLYLTPLQERIYRSFLQLDHVKALLYSKDQRRSPLVELNILKKLCDHPRLLSLEQCANLGLDVTKALPGSDIHAPSHAVLIEESAKVDFVVRLLERFQEEALASGQPAHRTIIFSQSLRLLDMTEAAILAVEPCRHKVLRLDGRLTKLEMRNQVLEKFERDPSYTVMLLTTQVGGVGLTITSADRVVVLDPSWNPSVDAQAVDRVFRIGQRQNVVVYRLITCASVEEKIYRRQIFKDSIIRMTIGKTAADRKAEADHADSYRYFTRSELRQLFTLDDDVHYSPTQRQLVQLHSGEQRNTYPELEEHLDFVKSLSDIVFDISDHDLLFSPGEHTTKEESVAPLERKFVEEQLQKGAAALRKETDVHSLKPSYDNPVGGIFKPSDVPANRPMYNVPHCGRKDAVRVDQFFKEVHVIPSKIAPDAGPLKPVPTSDLQSSTSSSSSGHEDNVVELDLTQVVDDDVIEQSAPLKSLRKSLATSVDFLGEGTKEEKNAEVVVVEDTSSEGEPGESPEEEGFPGSSVDIIEESLVEDSI